MIQTILWGISFVSLWTALIWLNFLYLPEQKKVKNAVQPKVTIAIPAHNEENTLAKTLRSLVALEYPKEKIEIIIVDDGSRDGTVEAAQSLIKHYPTHDIKLLQQKNQGKWAALNTALQAAKGDLFACLDADTSAEPSALRNIVPHFANNNQGAVISVVKVDMPKNLWERIQRIEYICSNFFRWLMSTVNTLSITPGVLSVYNAAILRKVGGFKYGGGTEDLEIALRLKAHQYDVSMERSSRTLTKVPTTWAALWRQRIRWYRGFFFNHWNYRALFFSKKHGLFGMYQLPMSVIGIGLMLTAVGLITFSGSKDLFEFIYRSMTIEGYFLNRILDIPTLKQFVLGHNIQIWLPILMATVLGFYLLYVAHRNVKENMLRQAHMVGLYVFVGPYVIALHWISAIFQEVFRIKRKW